MKIFVLLVCLLVVAGAYAGKEPRVKELFDNIIECVKELPKCSNDPKNPLIRPDVWFCALKKVEIYDKDDEIRKKRGVAYCDDVVLNAHIPYCKSVVSWCIDQGNLEPGSFYEKGLAMLECIILRGVMAFIGV